jgi:hypothetical protein
MDTDNEAVISVNQYFEDQFPGHETAWQRQDGGDWIGTCQLNTELYRLRVSSEFLSDCTQSQIHARLKAWDVADAMRNAGSSRLKVTRTGVMPE